MMRAMLLASAKVTSLLGRRCKTPWSKPDTLGRDRTFAHKPLGGQHIQIGDIAKSLGAQQLLGDILRGEADAGNFPNSDGGRFERRLLRK